MKLQHDKITTTGTIKGAFYCVFYFAYWYIWKEETTCILSTHPTEPEDPDIDAGELADALGNIRDVAHLTVRDIRQHLGLTQAAFAERFCIPRRTVENWEYKDKNPTYYILAIAELAGLLKVKRV